MKIEVNVSNKIARLVNREFVGVCGNSDYVIHFNFDSEWDAYDTKTARFKWGGSYTDVVFSGNECVMPVMYNTNRVEIGVYAGNLHTTTSALLKMKKSILCGAGAPADPTPDVYDQLMARMAQLENPDWAQNDPTAKDYVRNRTHWVSNDGTVHKLDEKYLPEVDEVDALATLAESGIVAPAYQDGTFYTAPTGEVYAV